MTALAIVAFLIVVGPLAWFYGVDSRLLGDKGWFGDPRR